MRTEKFENGISCSSINGIKRADGCKKLQGGSVSLISVGPRVTKYPDKRVLNVD